MSKGRKKKLASSCALKSGEGLLFVGAVLPKKADGTLCVTGKYGAPLTEEDMTLAAKYAAKQLLMQICDGAGGLDNVASILAVNVLVNCAPGQDDRLDAFADVISQALVDALGKRGEHTRTVLGMCTLEQNAPICCDAMVALRGGSDRV